MFFLSFKSRNFDDRLSSKMLVCYVMHMLRYTNCEDWSLTIKGHAFISNIKLHTTRLILAEFHCLIQIQGQTDLNHQRKTKHFNSSSTQRLLN